MHRRAASLRLDDGTIVGLVATEQLLHPWALVAALPAASLSVDWRVSCDDKACSIGSLRLGLSKARVAGLRLATRPVALQPDALAALVTSASPAGEGLPGAVRTALRSFADDGSGAALAAVVGLGEGLTPSGDDALVGALAGLDLASRAWPAAGDVRRELVGALPGELARRTTRISAQAIGAAVDGMYAVPLLAVLEALAASEPGAALDVPVARLLEVGHRSGRDTLVGLAAALELAGRPRPGRRTRVAG